jgi:hypothetical protein
MDTTHFGFEVTQPFLSNPGHPITVPRRQVPLSRLIEQQLDEGSFTIILPKGERFTAQMYPSFTSYGTYSQLRFTGQNRDLPQYLKPQDILLILLARLRGANYAIFEYSGSNPTLKRDCAKARSPLAPRYASHRQPL